MNAVSAELIDSFRPFYEGRRVLVTGGASFIGSHLVETLVAAGASVRVVDDLSSGRTSNLSEVLKNIEVIKGDVRDEEIAQRSVADQQIMFHLAATHGGRGYIDTHQFECLINMSVDYAIYRAAANAHVQTIVSASSACSYPINLQADAKDTRLLEESQAGFTVPGTAFPDGAYGWVKLMGEYQLATACERFSIDGAACRIFTAYGERENESHAVVALIAKALAKLDPYPIWGDGEQTRNFTYVGDTVCGLMFSGQHVRGFDVFNVGTNRHHTINELIEIIFDTVGWHPNAIDRQLDKPVGVLSRAADCTKVTATFGWTPGFPLTEGITRTTDWYRANTNPERLEGLNSLLMER